MVIALALPACLRYEPSTPDPETPLQEDTAISEPEPALELSQPIETIIIEAPAPMQEISGGMLEVNGYSEYFFEATLSLALCGTGGDGTPHNVCGTADNLLSQSFATIESPDIGLPGPFSGTITYNVSEQTRARLVVYSASARDGGIEHLSSVELILNP
jgi:hypothetical protein